MKTLKRILLAVLALSSGVYGVANALPLAKPAEKRILDVDYTAEGVIMVPVSKGVVTRIVLERGEKIIAAATGVPSKCDNDQHVWCVVADTDANEVWVKPKLGAKRNNLELKTDRRDYSIDLEVGVVRTYRVVIRYIMQNGVSGVRVPSDAEIVTSRLNAAVPHPKNVNYTLQSNQRGADIRPKAVFDDGLFTYLKFPGNSELPTIFVVGSDGAEARVNFNMLGEYMVVQRLGRKFILRLGKSVVTVWNESFDAQGVAPVNGTTVSGVGRENQESVHGH